MKIQNFSEEVIIAVGNYVYRLIDPRNGETFYIGRGVGNRVFAHIIEEESSKEGDELSDKIATIRDIKKAGLDVIHVIHRHGMDEDVAKEVEAALIDLFPSATNIQGGYGSNDYGPMNALEIENKYRAEEADFEKNNHKLIMININKSISEKDIYNAVRFAWKANIDRARKADYVLAVAQGVIEGVFVANEWMEATIENFSAFNTDSVGRIGFYGEEAPQEIKNLYLKKLIPKGYRKRGASNPIRYTYE